MKQQNRLACRTEQFCKTKQRYEDGSITFEAALIMPIIVLFIFVFYIFLIVCSAQMALHSLASSSVQQISAHLHPIQLSIEHLRSNSTHSPKQDGALNNENPTLMEADWAEVVYELSDLLPAPMDEIIQEALKGNWWPTTNIAASLVGTRVMEPFIRQQSTSQVLKPERIKLVYLQFPDLINYSTYHFGMTLEYELPFSIPFTNTPIVIREHALQRVWLPDARAADYEVTDTESPYIYIIGIEPNPIKPGRKATLKAITTPNRQLSLSIYYKSGKSVARNLGEQTANKEGEIEWTWHVSGNTTVGNWLLEISPLDGGAAVTRSFVVAKHSEGGR